MSVLHNHPNPETVSTTSCPACLERGGLSMQRARRGFSDEDVWSFDAYLAGVLAGGLKALRDNLHGCPPELCSDDDETWADEGVKRWQAILDEMIVGFAQWADENTDRERTPEVERSLELLVKWWGHLWD
jgi:hypothetical protein